MAAFTIAGERGKKPVHRLRAAATAIVQMSLYYSILMFAQAARGTLVTTRLASDTSDLRAFAVRAPQGTLRVCLINQNVARDERVAIDPGREFTVASMLRLVGPAIEATAGVTLGCASVNDFAGWRQ